MERSIRWLDRCIKKHEDSGKKATQNLFAIVQGGLNPDLRDRCLDAMIARRDGVAGYAIGGLSGGEEKGSCLGRRTVPHLIPLARRLLEDVRLPFFRRANSNRFHSIKQCAARLPEDRKPPLPCFESELNHLSGPRYSMGIGFAEGIEF